jgi:S-adenosylhomocysteine hydrolase
MNYDVADLSLAGRGRQRIAWAARHMPVLGRIAAELAVEQPFTGRRIAASLHITTETAVLLRTLKAGGAEVALCASNPLSTRDEVCAALVVEEGIAVYARYGEDLATYERHLEETLATDPHLVMDDGADLIVALHRRPAGGAVVAGIEETTTGVGRARALAAEGRLVGQSVAEASPAAVMDLSFADQALSARYLLDTGQGLPAGVYDVPRAIDERVARLKLHALGVGLDTLTEDQRAYQRAWHLGTTS